MGSMKVVVLRYVAIQRISGKDEVISNLYSSSRLTRSVYSYLGDGDDCEAIEILEVSGFDIC